ncbi:carbohydrate kinase, partial [Klebsiella oxytoca]
GGAKSDVWMQIFADAMDTDIVICSGTEFGAKGAALNVGVALGIYSDYEDAAASTVHEVKRFKPDKEKHKRYQKLYGLYRKGYEL